MDDVIPGASDSEQDGLESVIQPTVEDQQEVLPVEVAIFSSTHPFLTVQHSERKDLTDKDSPVENYEYKFMNGVIRFFDDEDLQRFRRAVKCMNPMTSHYIRELPSRAEAERIAREHASNFSRQTTAHRGPLTTGAIQARDGDRVEQQFAKEAVKNALHVPATTPKTIGDLKNLIRKGA